MKYTCNIGLYQRIDRPRLEFFFPYIDVSLNSNYLTRSLQ